MLCPTDVYAASGQRVGPGESRHSVLPNATRYGPHTLRGAGWSARTRRAHARGLTTINFTNQTIENK